MLSVNRPSAARGRGGTRLSRHPIWAPLGHSTLRHAPRTSLSSVYCEPPHTKDSTSPFFGFSLSFRYKKRTSRHADMCTAPTPTIASHTTPPDRSMSSCSNAHSSCPEAPTQRLGKERDEAEGQHNLCSPEAPREPLFSIRSVISLAITQLSQSQIRATRTLLSWSRLSPLGAPRASRPNAIPNPENGKTNGPAASPVPQI